MKPALEIVFLGLSLSSSWGNGHATTYRALLRGLARARPSSAVPRARRCPGTPPHATCRGRTSASSASTGTPARSRRASARAIARGRRRHRRLLCAGRHRRHRPGAGAAQRRRLRSTTSTRRSRWRACDGGDRQLPVAPRQIPRFDLYLSFTGGPTLERAGARVRRRGPRALYCAVDDDRYRPHRRRCRVWDLGYLGTYARPPADAGAAADRAGAAAAGTALRGRRTAISRSDRLAGQCRAHRASAARRSMPPSTAGSASP